VELSLEVVVVVVHGGVEGGGVVVGEEVGFPIEDEVVILVGEDEVDEAFDVVIF